MLTVNMKQISKWIVTQDNVKFYDNIMKSNGTVVTLDTRPYIELLTDFGIFFTTTLSIDTKSTHITPVDGNVFVDLGFEPAEAAELKAESQRIIAKSTTVLDTSTTEKFPTKDC